MKTHLKKQISVIFITLLMNQYKVIAQPTWSANGGGVVYTNRSVGIGTSTPLSKFSIGTTSQFRVDANGNLVRINNIPYSFPSAQGNIGSVLMNDGAGVLTWGAIPTEPSNSWNLNGNTGTVDGVNFIGTIDDVPFNIKVNNQQAGRIDNSSLGSTFFGYQAGYANPTAAANTAFGYQALFSTTTPKGNTANGYQALYSNTIGYYNTAVGTTSLVSNTEGWYNTAIGSGSLQQNKTGTYNTAVGSDALTSMYSGDRNTALGYAAAFDIHGGIYNSTTIGAFAVGAGSNQVRIGNGDVSSIGGFADWTNISDARFKKDIKETVPGLEFILKLRPVTYHLDMDKIASFLKTPDSVRSIEGEALKSKMLQTGFIAQEVEKSAEELGFDFSGVDKPKNDKDYYGLRYAEFTVPLVKAVQEQQKMIEELKKEIANLKSGLPNVTNTHEQSSTIPVNRLDLSNIAVLYQNAPNPFIDGTNIKYSVPDNSNAQIVFYDEFGTQVKEFRITGKGMGQLNISASNLAAGVYSYSLLIDGKVIDTKKMVHNK